MIKLRIVHRAPLFRAAPSSAMILCLIAGCGDQYPPSQTEKGGDSPSQTTRHDRFVLPATRDEAAASGAQRPSILESVKTTGGVTAGDDRPSEAAETYSASMEEVSDVLHVLFSGASGDQAGTGAVEEANDIVKLAASLMNDRPAGDSNEDGTYATVKHHLDTLSADLEKQIVDGDVEGATKSLNRLKGLIQMYLPPSEAQEADE